MAGAAINILQFAIDDGKRCFAGPMRRIMAVGTLSRVVFIGAILQMAGDTVRITRMAEGRI